MQLPSLESRFRVPRVVHFGQSLDSSGLFKCFAGKVPCMHRRRWECVRRVKTNTALTGVDVYIWHYKSVEAIVFLTYAIFFFYSSLFSFTAVHSVPIFKIMLMLCKSHVKFCYVKSTWPCIINGAIYVIDILISAYRPATYAYAFLSLSVLCKSFGIGLIWFIWESRAVQGISHFSLPLLVVIAWPVQASVCDSHKVETQTALLFFIFFTFSSFVQVGRIALPKLGSLWTGDCECNCIWCDQNVVNQLTNIFCYFVFWNQLSCSELEKYYFLPLL